MLIRNACKVFVFAEELCNFFSRTVSTALIHRCRIWFDTVKLGILAKKCLNFKK